MPITTIELLKKSVVENESKVYRILSWVFGLLTFSIVAVYGSKAFFQSVSVVGESFVLEELAIPFLPFIYAKPITWFSFFAFLYWTFGLESYRKRFMKLESSFRRILFVVVALIAFGSLYEILFNFALWTALMAVTGMMGVLNPDVLVNVFDVSRAINLVFATKICFLIFGLSAYSLYYLRAIDRDPEKSL